MASPAAEEEQRHCSAITAAPVAPPMASDDDRHELPSQNQLYAVLMLSCGAWRVRRPHRVLTALVDDIDQRPETIAQRVSERNAALPAPDATDAKARAKAEGRTTEAALVIARAANEGVRLDADAEATVDDEGDAAAATDLVTTSRDLGSSAAAVVSKGDRAGEATHANAAVEQLLRPERAAEPLAHRTSIELGDVYFGNANLCVLLDLMAHLPLIEVVDWSGQRLFAVDGYKQGPPGNEIIERLMRWAARQRNLTTIRLGAANPIGTRCVHWMVDAVERNPGLVTIDFDESAIDAFLLKKLHRALERNRTGSGGADNTKRTCRARPASPPPFYRLTEQLREMDTVDRKTAADRRELHTLLREFQDSFIEPLEHDSEAGAKTAASTAANGGSARASGIIDGLLLPPPLPTSGKAVSDDAAAAASAGDVGGNELERFLSGIVAKSLRRSSAECIKASRGLRGDGGSVFIVDSGSLVAHIGGHDMMLGRGDYFGEVLESEMYVAGQVDVEARGHVFQVPHEAMQPLMRMWEAKVRDFLPILKQVAPLQPLPSWALIRACHDASVVTHAKGTTVLSKGAGPAGLFVVLRGSYMVRGRAKLGRAQVVFGPGDIFGEEAAVSRLGVYSVDIKASNDEAESAVLLLNARHVKRHFVPHLRSVLAVHAKGYSDVV